MIENIFENLLAEVLVNTKGEQMEEEEYRYIASFLGNKNFLVFGCGHDTNLWRYVNKTGHTVFLESNPDWIWDTKDTFLVTYTTTLGKSKSLLSQFNSKNYKNLFIDLPKEVLNTSWDCILIDAPPGGSKKHPGRMQSIFMANHLSHIGTNIFIHDCDRQAENEWSSLIFKKLKKELTKLRHYEK